MLKIDNYVPDAVSEHDICLNTLIIIFQKNAERLQTDRFNNITQLIVVSVDLSGAGLEKNRAAWTCSQVFYIILDYLFCCGYLSETERPC